MVGRLAQTSAHSRNLVILFIRNAKNSKPNKASVWDKLHLCMCVCGSHMQIRNARDGFN